MADPPAVALTDLPSLLAWEASPGAWRPWRTMYDAFLWRRARALCAQNPDDACIALALQALPPAKRRRFLRTPQVARLLYRQDGEHPWRGGATFARELLAELGSALPRDRGNTLLPAALTLDIDGDAPFPDEDDGFATLCYRPGECDRVVSKLRDAMMALRRLSPTIAALVTSWISVLALRRQPGKPNALFSSTFSHAVGLVRITNAHLAEADRTSLMDALVHEAIHSLLYGYEESRAPFQTEPAWRVPIRSPWTGATLALPSYLQACLVWYGLYHLWRLAQRAGFGPAERVAALAGRARTGFHHRPVSQGLADYHAWVAPDCLALLYTIEGRMLNEVWV
ncbi:MAG: hypothetical protein JO171_16330 [Paludibacterium sp.]|uniref:aKG-HExxH-type peptide beta-hydroxylase n=1 Tax=Paludibacterium sp. TaxID=1917523 RepID=UPI0025FC3830|nr:HEXXH motif-containing putative peptide modification protein [Paludibacterium sp.]MBV8048717.1 hypothetical protein [Paludibacterium sp.]MBV8649006.1 hypothetical protein [Paludibacterium sp.]